MPTPLRLILALLALALSAAALPAQTRPVRWADGFSVLPVAADARLVFVSTSAGDDANPGDSADRPVRSFNRARTFLRTGFPDRLLLKAGDVFGPIGVLNVSGRSADWPFVVSAYGDGPRPRVEAWNQVVSFDGRKRIDHIAIVGIEFCVPWRDPSDPRYNPEHVIDGKRVVEYDSVALRVLGQGASNILLEDCVFRAFREGPQFFGVKTLTVRRNMFLDSWSAGGKSQGLYIDSSEDVVVEENLFDGAGNPPPVVLAAYPNAKPNQLNHGLYAQDNGRSEIRFVGNIVARSSSHGVQLRPGGEIRGNAFIGNAIAGFAAKRASSIVDNVVLRGRDIDAGNRRGWGLSVVNVPSAVITGNVVANKDAGVGAGWPYELQFDAPAPVAAEITFEGNKVYGWGSQNVSNPRGVPGTFTAETGPFEDPDRSESTYAASIGVPDFLQAARSRPRGQWPAELSAEALNAYVRAGFVPASARELARREAVRVIGAMERQIEEQRAQLETVKRALAREPAPTLRP
jgi:hypothetical protein